MKIGVVGSGFVGKATQTLHHDNTYLYVYDIIPELCQPVNTTLKDMRVCDIIFICVPTPCGANGECHLGIVDSVVTELQQHINPNTTHIVIRSTVPPGTSKKYGVFFIPEFLTERNYINDFINNKNWVIGLTQDEQRNADFKSKIQELFTSAKNSGNIMSDNLHFSPSCEAEMVKYIKNCFLATKVSFFNEMYKICDSIGLNYNEVQQLVTLDTRIGNSHTDVPGPDGNFGFGGICFPKDIRALQTLAHTNEVPTPVLTAAITRNSTIDRPEADWKVKGRSII